MESLGKWTVSLKFEGLGYSQLIVIRISRSVDGGTSRPVLLPSGMIYDHKTMRVFQPF